MTHGSSPGQQHNSSVARLVMLGVRENHAAVLRGLPDAAPFGIFDRDHNQTIHSIETISRMRLDRVTVRQMAKVGRGVMFGHGTGSLDEEAKEGTSDQPKGDGEEAFSKVRWLALKEDRAR